MFNIICNLPNSAVHKKNIHQRLNFAKMPEIIVKISKGSKEISTQATDVSPLQLPALLNSLKKAKEQANDVLSKLVEDAKSSAGNNQKPAASDEDNEEDSSEDDET